MVIGHLSFSLQESMNVPERGNRKKGKEFKNGEMYNKMLFSGHRVAAAFINSLQPWVIWTRPTHS